MLRHILLFSVFLRIGMVEAEAQPTAQRAEPVTEAAPLLLLHGPYEETRVLAAALGDVALRDGSAFIDLSPTPIAPPSSLSELRHAVAAYQEFDYGRAMKHLSAAFAEIQRDGVRGLSSSELCDLFIYRALVRNAQGDRTAAWDDFIQAALVDPTRHLDAVRFSPSVAASFERARTKVMESRSVLLQAGLANECTLFVDAQERGPIDAISVRAGSHFLRVECPGYRSYSVKLLVDDSQTFAPELVEVKIPDRAYLLAMAQRRGFRHFVFVHVALHLPANAPADAARFELLHSDGTELGRTSMSLRGGPSDRALAVATLSRLLDVLVPVVPETNVVGARRTWYESPWLWAAAGVVVTSAILLPFALRDSPSAGFRIELGGDLP